MADAINNTRRGVLKALSASLLIPASVAGVTAAATTAPPTGFCGNGRYELKGKAKSAQADVLFAGYTFRRNDILEFPSGTYWLELDRYLPTNPPMIYAPDLKRWFGAEQVNTIIVRKVA